MSNFYEPQLQTEKEKQAAEQYAIDLEKKSISRPKLEHETGISISDLPFLVDR